jgi:hypothetical protein
VPAADWACAPAEAQQNAAAAAPASHVARLVLGTTAPAAWLAGSTTWRRRRRH